MKKSGTQIPANFRFARTPGQVPSRENREALKLAESKPPKFKASMLLDHTEPVMRVEAITKGLGMDPVAQNSWNKFLGDQLDGGHNELIMRKAIHQRMLDERMDPSMRKAIVQRSLNYYRGKMKKSLVQVVTPDEILEKAEARGGTYHRRVARKSGKGFNYYYDPEKYASSKDAHLSGKEAKASRVQKAVSSLVEGAEKGCSVDDMKALAKKYGSQDVASHLKKQCGEGGSMEYKGGKFKLKKSKSLEPDFKFVLGDNDHE